MSLVIKYDGVELPSGSVRMVGSDNAGGVAGLPGAAFAGETGIAGIQIEDPDGDLIFDGWHDFTVDETACSKPRIFTGWLIGKQVSRGAYRTGPGRIWDCDIIDENALFSMKVYRASSAKRPAEPDTDRIDFALDSAPLSGLFTRTAYANVTDNPINFGEASYIKQFPGELFNSVAGTSGKNYYAFYDHDEGDITIYYDVVDATNRTSDLRISNVRSDVDGTTTFYPKLDATLDRDPAFVYSGILLGYKGSYIYDQRAATITDYIDRDLVYETDRVGHLATAQALVDDMLIAHSIEQDTITVTVRLPADKVNLIDKGERVEVKFSHLPGYESFTFVRVVRRTVVPSPNRKDWYDLHLELSNKAPERGPGSGGGGSGDLFPPDPAIGDHWWSGAGSVAANDGIVQIGPDAPLFVPGIYTYEITVDQAPNPGGTYATDVGITDDPNLFIGHGIFLIDSVPGPRGSGVVYTGSFEVQGDGDLVEISTSDSPGPDYNTISNFSDQYYFSANAAGTASYNKSSLVTFWFDLEGVSGDPQPPLPGQPWGPETPIITSAGPPAVYMTRWPYADGSLRVFVDNLNQTAAVTETDPATGEFELAFTPRADEIVRIWYTGR